jgi:hypothetical protein
MTRRFCLVLLGGAAAAQIVKPHIGYIVDEDNCLRAVEGVAGAFFLGPVLARDVVSAAFSGKTLVVKQKDKLRVGDRTFDAPEGPAVIVFGRTSDVLEIFFPAAGVLWTWHGGEVTSAPASGVVADAYIRDGELILDGIPVRLASEARNVSSLGEGWLVVYCVEGMYAIRGSQIFELPGRDIE